MTPQSRETLRARMAARLDRELVERARVRLEERGRAGREGDRGDTGQPAHNLVQRLARDVWQIAARALRMPADQLDPGENLANLGIDSIAITEVMVQISRHFAISVAPTTFFEAKHLNDLAGILLARHSRAIAARYDADEEPQSRALDAPGARADDGEAAISQTAKAAPQKSTDPALAPPSRDDVGSRAEPRHAWLARHREIARRLASAEAATPTAHTSPRVSGAISSLASAPGAQAVNVASAPGVPSASEPDSANTPIAIIAMEGKFPQSPDLETFAAHLRAGDDCIEEVPAERWDWRAVYGDPAKGAFTDVKYGGFVPEIDKFDAAFFNISPREAELIDPQHRLFMECVWSLIERAGYAPGALGGRNISLFLGINLLDYTEMANRAGLMEAQQLTGLGHAFAPNRLSFLLDIHGPSEVIDTACSSSLVAIHRAVMSIRHEGCEMAIAGGSNLMLSPMQHIMFSKVGMITPDGRCKSFSANADGYARADGVGAVLLKRLDLAERDGDPIVGVIRASLAHHGGGATSLTAPNPKSQARLIVEAHRQAGVDPRSITMIECHGTGTPLGDPVEVEGLKQAFADLYREHGLMVPGESTIGLGSVKSNIGHAETAAGVAGLIKVLLAMREETLFRSLHCEEPNPLLELDGSPFYLLDESRPWHRPLIDGIEQPLRAGISSFGAGGANVHLVVEKYRQQDRLPPIDKLPAALVFPVSAKSRQALREGVARLRVVAQTADLNAMAATLQLGRDAMRHRVAFVAASRDALLTSMGAFVADGVGAEKNAIVPAEHHGAPAAVDPAGMEARAIADHWVGGGALDWSALYRDRPPRRIALPGYAFQRKRYWLDVGSPSHAMDVGMVPARALGQGKAMLADRASRSSLSPSPTRDNGAPAFQITFSGNEHFLADHRVAGTRVLPGVAYLEMVRAAAEEEGFTDIALRRVVWMAPLAVERLLTVTCEITRLAGDGARAEVSSVAHDGSRIVHAQMHIARAGGEKPRAVVLSTLRSAIGGHRNADDIYAAFAAIGLAYGPAHRVISDLSIKPATAGNGEVLASLELPQALHASLDNYVLHPSLLDGAFQAAIGLAGEANVAALPFSLDSIVCFGLCEARMWVHVRQVPGKASGSTLLDIDLIAADGTIRVAIRGFATRAIDSHSQTGAGNVAGDAEFLTFAPVWRPVSRAHNETNFERRVVLLSGGRWQPEDISAAFPRCAGFVIEENPGDPLAQRYISCAQHLLAQSQAILREAKGGSVLLQFVIARDADWRALSGLAGLLRCAQREHTRLHAQVVCVAHDCETRDLVRHLRTAQSAPGGALLRVEKAGLTMQTYDEVASEDLAPPVPWRANGIYLITGGAGKLARIVASDILALAPEATVILAGRRPPQLSNEPPVGARFESVDVSDEAALVALVERIRHTHGGLHGVIHAAGVVDDDALLRKSAERAEAVLAPKVRGAAALDAALGNAPLDFLVLFSSISGITGNAGQADYAAANAFLDGFAELREKRRAAGLCQGRTLSISWPLWADGGMPLDPTQEALMRRVTGLVPLATSDGLRLLHAALAGEEPRLLVGAGEGERIRRFVGGSTGVAAARTRDDTGLGDDDAAVTPRFRVSDPDSLRRAVRAALFEEAGNQLKVASDDLEGDVELTEYGFDSIGFTQFANRLNDRFALELTPTLFFEFPTLDGLTDHLAREETVAMAQALDVSAAPVAQPAAEAFARATSDKLADSAIPPHAAETAMTSPEGVTRPERIAIIGMAGQFPGAADIDEFWQVLAEGRDSIREVPSERWDWRDYWGDPMSQPGRGNAKWGGFIDDIAAFDAAFFGISAPEARMMDPQQRLLLTQSWRLMEDAGYAPSALAGTRMGVFIGIADTGYSRLVAGSEAGIEGYSMTALAPSLGPNRISYTYDFHGPSVAVETACSSALVALHRALEAIRLGHCTAAIAGGVNALLLPEAFVGFSKAGMLSPDGRCKTFSAQADGYVRGEGIGLFLLKPLDTAVADGDRILAVIRASGENHGGRAASLTAPNPKAQADLLRSVYARSGIDPRTVSYIEAHGTGTPLGDPIEIEALNAAFCDLECDARETFGPAPAQKCAIGSVKSNIGHLEIAAGAAGLIKVLLQLRNDTIAASLHCDNLNPYLKLAGSPFHIANRQETWVRSVNAAGEPQPRRAGVSSFGFGGSNAHVVLEEYIAGPAENEDAGSVTSAGVIVLSARSQAQLEASARNLHAFLSAVGDEVPFPDLAHTLQVAREPMEHRLAFAAASVSEVVEKLSGYIEGRSVAGLHTGQVKTNRKIISVLESDAALSAAAADLAQRGGANEVAALWVAGFAIDWTRFARSEAPRRIALPGYPFAKTHYWIDTARQPHENGASGDSSSTRFTFDGSESFLRDHVVNGAKILPGVVSLELVRDALQCDGARSGSGWGAFELVGHTWSEPVAIGAEPCDLAVRLMAAPQGSYRYTVTFDTQRHHCQGVARRLATDCVLKIDLEAARATALDRLDPAALYRRYEAMGLAYGSAQRAIAQLYRGQDIVVARLEVPAGADASFALNPAILDGALQAALALFNPREDAPMVPYSLRRACVYRSTAPVMWAIVRRREAGLDIDVCDVTGTLAVRLEDLVARAPSLAPVPTLQGDALASRQSGGNDRATRALDAVVAIAAETLEVEPRSLDVDTELGDFGFDSVTMTAFASRINSQLDLSLTPADFFEFATLARLARHVAGLLPQVEHGLSERTTQPTADTIVDVRPAGALATPAGRENGHDHDPIVIVGQSCTFPMARDGDAFWSNLVCARDCIARIPADRWDWRAIDGDPKQEPGRTDIHWGGFIDGVFEFDPLFFNISPREARLMDPQQRLMLMHAWKAIEDAGHDPRELAGARVGVFVATSSSGYCEEYEARGGEKNAASDGYVATGSVPSVGPNRISYFLDLHGPSEPVETACSSSLVALHRAVQAIRSGDCDMALVGGVNTMVTPDGHINFSKAGMLARDGRCKTFSAKADGYVRGEGVGMLFVRRLSQAERDGDPVLAIIRASGINHGGHGNSLTAPNTQAQADLIRDVYENAGIDPRTIGYIEAHGTGTALGDPVEINALKSAFRALSNHGGALEDDGCAIGAVKTNIGHLELAAGVAGVIKVLKQIEHRQLAPSLHCNEINPYIDFADSGFALLGAPRAWQPVRDEQGQSLPLRAGISSFGFGGVNAHVVLEEYRPAGARETSQVVAGDACLVVLSARDDDRLRQSAANLTAFLETGSVCDADLNDLAWTLKIGRTAMVERLAIVARGLDDVRAGLGAFLDGRSSEVLYQSGIGARANGAIALKRDADAGEIARHWVAGGDVDWRALDPRAHRRLRLPSYPFARDVYRLGAGEFAKTTAAAAEHGPSSTFRKSDVTSAEILKMRLNADAFYLRDHIVRGHRILPGAMGLAIVQRALATHSLTADGFTLSGVTWRVPLQLDGGETTVSVTLSGNDGAASFGLASAIGEHLRGRVAPVDALETRPSIDIAVLERHCRLAHDPDWLYASYAALGIDYGATFRCVVALASHEDEALARLRLPPMAEADACADDDGLHPAIVDAAFHAALALFSHEGVSRLALPFGIDRVRVFASTQRQMWAHLRKRSAAPGLRKLDIDLADTDGRICLRIEGFALRVLTNAAPDEAASGLRPDERSTSNADIADRPATERYFVDLIARESEIDAGDISLGAPLEAYGIDSVMITRLTDELERDFGPLSRTLFFEHQTLESVIAHFRDKHGDRLAEIVADLPHTHEIAHHDAGDPPRLRAQNPGSWAAGASLASDEPIAIIGLAGRYPGARSMEEFWRNLAAGRDSVTQVPGERWDHGRYYSAQRQPGKTTSKWGGFVDGFDRFDPLFFNIAPREAHFIDPQERLFLQCAWETLEDAGYTRASVAPGAGALSGGDVGVFVGVMYEEYQLYGAQPAGQASCDLAITGSAASIANRVSYFCNFHGPSIALDTMCSSSLTAIHLACDSLRAGSCAVALAGGVNLTPHPNKYIALSHGRFLSSIGRCESFGEGGDGYVPAEGVGAVLLKPLSRAQADGDRIHGVILACALNHGGKTNGYTVPNPSAQAAVIERALEKAGVTPDDISYVEAHGTGTSLGDPIEISALTRAYRSLGDAAATRAIGSVKSNIGHAESAAGIAGLSKVLLQMKHGQLAPSLHAETLNANIDWDDTPFTVQRRLQPWLAGHGARGVRPRIAGLSSFGAGGSNAHLIISEYRAPARPITAAKREVYPFSARDRERLHAVLERFRSALREFGDTADLPAVAYVLQEGREAFEERLAIVADGAADLAEKLDAALNGHSQITDMWRARANARTAAPDVTSSPEILAEHWVGGAAIDWAGRRSGPKPTPISLPSYPFAEDRCWLPDLDMPAKRPAPGREAMETARLPLLFAPDWQECVAPPTQEGAGERLVILCGLPHVEDLVAGSAAEIVVLETTGAKTDAKFAHYAVQLMERLQRLIAKRPAAAIVQVVVPSDADEGLLEGLGGLLRCVSLEHRSIVCQLICLDDEKRDLARCLAANAARAGKDRDIRYIAGRRLVRAWRQVATPDEPAVAAWARNGTYLLTGGAGGVGLHVAQAIAAQGETPSLWLTGRSAPDADIEARLATLEASGACVHYRRVDVTDAGALSALLSEIEACDGRLNGIFHGAGVTRDGMLATKNEETIRAVLAPKVSGVCALDDALADRRLDFFVLFGSAAGALGNPGQSDYAAANAFLDRFAEERNARVSRGQCHGRTVAIDWPYWRDGGMRMPAATMTALERETGVAPLETMAAILALKVILAATSESQVLVLDGDHDRLRAMMEPGGSEKTGSRPAAVQACEPVIHAKAAGIGDDVARIAEMVRTSFSRVLDIPLDRLSDTDTIDRFGVDSVSALDLVEDLEKTFGALPQTILFEFPTIARLAGELATRDAGEPRHDHAGSNADEARLWEQAGQGEQAFTARDIAIIAAAGRYPGADTIEAFAEVLRQGRDCITEIPSERSDLVPHYSSRKGEPGTSHSKWGGFISGIDRFDSGFFGYTPRAADLADPQERLFLETTWHLFERAGHTRAWLAEHYQGRVGVFVGAMYNQYPALADDAQTRAALALTSYSAIANRTSYFFDLQGPSVALDSMCSSGLQAVHQARQSLRAGECRLAVAGGVNLSIHPAKYQALSGAGLVASNATSRAFAGGDGYLPAEGVGAVLLKPMTQALRDGDRILGVVRGSLANHAGHSAGYGVPNADAQERLLTDAFEAAGVDPATIGYAEAAATGARIGDAIELRALAGVMEKARRATPLAVGSVKANMGHAEAASGLAQLTKVLLQFERREVFPTPGFAAQQITDAFRDTPLVPQAERTPWHGINIEGVTQPRRAMVSSFGAGGSNVHLILEEPPEPAHRPHDEEPRPRHEEPQPRLFPLSARTPEQLAALRISLVEHLREHDGISMAALSQTLRHGREMFAWRQDVVASDAVELVAKWLDPDYREAPEILARAQDAARNETGNDGRGAMLVLPGYPFAREKHWLSGPITHATKVPPGSGPLRTDEGENGQNFMVQKPDRTVLDIIRSTLATELGVSLAQVGDDTRFDVLGLDSMVRMRLSYAVEEKTGQILDRDELERNPTPRALADSLESLTDRPVSRHDEDDVQTHGDSPLDCPLSENQKGLWVLQKLDPQRAGYNVPLAFKVRALDETALGKAVDWLLARHRLLAACVDEEGSRFSPNPQAARVNTISIPKEIETTDFVRSRGLMPLDLSVGVVRIDCLRGGKLEEGEAIVLLVQHHIVTDGTASAVVTRDLWNAYDSFLEGKPVANRDVGLSADYRDFVAWETAFMASDRGQNQKRFWLETLNGDLCDLAFPSRSPPQQPGGAGPQSLECRLPEDLSEKIRQTAISARCGVASFYLAVFATLVLRYTGEEDLVFGVPTLRRPSRRFENTVGYCANMMALRIAVDPALSIPAFCQHVDTVLVKGTENADFPFAAIARERGGTATGDAPYQIAFSYQDFSFDPASVGPIARGDVAHLAEIRQSGDAPFGIEVQDNEAGRLVVATFDGDRFSTVVVQRLLGHFCQLLRAATTEEKTPLSELQMLTRPEIDRALHHWSRSARDRGEHRLVHEAILERADKTPNAIALSSGSERVRYKDLAHSVKRFVRILQRYGARPGDRVAVLLGREADSVAILLAVLATGSVWVPLDPEMPDERLGYIVRDAGALFILTRSDLAGRARGFARRPARVIDLERERIGIRARFAKIAAIAIEPSEPAYILYTSGSTGLPKGVVISHGALAEHCEVIAREYALGEKDIVLQFASCAVDTAIEQILPTLMTGARLVLRPAELQAPDAFLAFLGANAITLIDLPPVYLHELLSFWLRGNADLSGLSLRLVIVGGEALAPETVALWEASGLSWVRLVNAYGPTEATITAMVHTVRQRAADERVAIGRPLAGTDIYILDRYGNMVPDGVVGELHIGGARLALGYHQRPDLTDQKFRIHHLESAPVRLYRTGDLASFRPNTGGTVDFHGRIDDQVKIRGHRVELGEVEAALARDGIEQVAVLLERNRHGDPVLSAYLGVRGEAIDIQALQRRLSARLPAHMVPSVWCCLDQLPTTASGKIDRRALKTTEDEREEECAQIQPPRDSLEKRLLAVWSQVLGLDPQSPAIGIGDDFAHAGGNSLLAVRLLSVMDRTFGCSFTLQELASASTVAAQARLLRRRNIALADEAGDHPREQGVSGSTPLLVSLWQPDPACSPVLDPPLFLVHPIAGTLTGYGPFVDELAAKGPVYGIRAAGLEPGEKCIGHSVEALAAEYTHCITQKQPRGPYRLCGWSFGGVVAFEIARNLVKAGAEVSMLALIDSYLPDGVAVFERNADEDEGDRNNNERCRRAFLRDLFGADMDLRNEADIVDIVMALPQLSAVLPGATREQVKRLFSVFEAHYVAFREYDPQPCDMPALLVRAGDDAPHAGPCEAWRTLVGGALIEYRHDADHYSLLRYPHLRAWVPVLREALAREGGLAKVP